MKKSLWKNNFKEIIKTKRRFISMMVMAFLGVGFFSGLVATGPNMRDSVDKYADSYNLFDIDVISTLGLTDDDLKAIKNIDGIENSYGIKSKDTIAKIEEKENICKVIAYNENCNIPAVIKGRLPENKNECLLDRNYSITNNIYEYIGKTIILENEEVDSNNNPIFNQKEFTIVGITESPLYIANERGHTTIGNGSIDFFIYANSEVINLDYYTNIYSIVKGAKKLQLNSEEYWKLVNPVILKVEEIKENQEEERYNKLINEAENKLNDAQQEFNKEKQKVDDELKNAENKINEGKNQILKSENELNNLEKEINLQEKNAKSQFEASDKKINNGENQIAIKKKELESAKIEFETKRKEAEEGIKQLNISINDANNNLNNLLSQKEELEKNGLDTSYIDEIIEKVKSTLESLKSKKTKIEEELQSAEKKLKNGQDEIIKAENELKKQRDILNNTKKDTINKISNGKARIASGKKELEKAKRELEKNDEEFKAQKQDALQKLDNAQKELDKAKDEINKIEKAKWYIRNRKDNVGYANIIDAIKTITNISKLFPAIFYFVAILISLTSMTRMIEEERTEIGTLKALGYTNTQIIIKYILYAFLACVIGGFLGMTAGFYLIPNIVWDIYDAIYKIPEFYTSYRLDIGLLGLIIAFICIGGATIFVASKELKNMPSTLMRPKSPKNGKKILLERIPFIWNKFNFSKKVIARNIFRYKKRAIMTIVGIAGCTGLMVTGFGLKDSVMDIPESQYGEIFTYNMSISLSEDKNLSKIEEIINNNKNIESYSKICASAGKLKGQENNYETAIFIPETIQDFEKVCHLKDVKTYEKVALNDEGIIISDKVAEMLNIKKGENITLIDSDNTEYLFKVTGIVENYVSNYVYMTKNFYEKNIKSHKTNMILIKTKAMTEDIKNQTSESLLQIEGVAEVSMISDTMKAIKDMLNSLNYVVIILIVASALLAFVVLYNLANINIGERQREIATLKVLGFYDKEVDNYINKENIIFTIVGVFLGLIFGYFLTEMIVMSVEIDKMRFIRNIKLISYVYAAIISTTFSLIVNYIIHFVLKKIDMIESLKSIE